MGHGNSSAQLRAMLWGWARSSTALAASTTCITSGPCGDTAGTPVALAESKGDRNQTAGFHAEFPVSSGDFIFQPDCGDVVLLQGDVCEESAAERLERGHLLFFQFCILLF